MGKIIHLENCSTGVSVYHPELGEKEPTAKMKATISPLGDSHYYIDTPLELKGRGIVEMETFWVEGCREYLENWRSYRVTKRVYDKLKTKYSISMEALLD